MTLILNRWELRQNGSKSLEKMSLFIKNLSSTFSVFKIFLGSSVLLWCGRRDLNPGSLAWKANVLNQTRRQPHFTLRVFPYSKLNLNLLQPSKDRFAD